MIFLDTGFLFAFFAESDRNRPRVLQVLHEHRGTRLFDHVLTSNHVIAETITLVRARGHRDLGTSHRLAVEVGQKLFSGAFARIHQATAEEERAAFSYLARYEDKEYSFVDCLSFVIMEKQGIDVAWSVDDDFNHRFRAVPGPLPK